MNRSTGISIAIGLGVGIAVISSAQLGPLDPPAGPIMETSPSLADLESQIAALSSGTPELTTNQILWISTDSSSANDVYVADEALVEGRVLLHKIIAYRARVCAFDGPGSIESNGFGRPLSGIAIGWTQDALAGTTPGLSSDSALAIEFNTIAENGLHLAYDFTTNDGFIQVLYRELD